MTVKFNQYWRIDPEKAQEYEKFMLTKYIPGVNQLGIHIVAGWVVLVGGYSEILCEGTTTDLHLLETALTHQKYKELNNELLNCIKSYKTKVLVSSGRKDAYSKDIKISTIKFTQAWDVVSKNSGDYQKYSMESFYPCLEELGIKVAGEWEVIIGDGPRIICEGRADEAHNLVERLQSARFQKVRKELKQFVENYESRILTFHIQKVEGYKSQRYQFVAG
ncbi:MAG: hypothetical protein HY895_04570 [Deltaproteobacteria bacterium]|nr:hypothetical protein [Deltaproteobacteria bacterium]